MATTTNGTPSSRTPAPAAAAPAAPAGRPAPSAPAPAPGGKMAPMPSPKPGDQKPAAPSPRVDVKPAPVVDAAARAAKTKALEAAVGQIEKNYGKGSIMRLDNESVPVIPSVSSGALSLDLALGGRGLPRGRIIEVFGPESSGKTTLALTVISNCQKQGGVAAFIDAEHALDPSWAKRLGVNLDEILVSQPDTGEQALEICEMLVRSNAVEIGRAHV